MKRHALRNSRWLCAHPRRTLIVYTLITLLRQRPPSGNGKEGTLVVRSLSHHAPHDERNRSVDAGCGFPVPGANDPQLPDGALLQWAARTGPATHKVA